MKILLFLLTFLSLNCSAQIERNVGGPCEGCEGLLEYGEDNLSNVDTIPGFSSLSPKVKVTGTVYQKDGSTPAKDIIVYLYQTDREGIYKANSKSKGWGRRHGIHRGWIKTNEDGKYTFYTFRPGAYPNGIEPEHIHLTVKEPTTNAYFIDSVMFNDDPLLTKSIKASLDDRAGNGVIDLELSEGILVAQRDIILGLNIPNY